MTKEMLSMCDVPHKASYTFHDMIQLADKIKTEFKTHIFKWVSTHFFCKHIHAMIIAVWRERYGCACIQHRHHGPPQHVYSR